MLATETEAPMIPESDRAEQHIKQWTYWVEQLEREANRIEMIGVWVLGGGLALGAILDWLFDWKFVYYPVVAIGCFCWLDAYLMKYPEAKRRRFVMSVLAPLEDSLNRIEQRVANIEKIRGTDERA